MFHKSFLRERIGQKGKLSTHFHCNPLGGFGKTMINEGEVYGFYIICV